jgi:ornithine cyclodeaminase/alanine dehydrogenase-like protein (mu-crystallin family)
MRILERSETENALTIPEAAEVIRKTYRALGEGRIQISEPSAMVINSGTSRFRLKGAILEDFGIAGVRTRLGKHARTILWDLETGLPTALVNEDWLGAFRTGVSAAVVAEWLWQKPHPIVAVIGAGPIAGHMVEAFDALLRPATIRVTSRSGTSAEALAARMTHLATPVSASPDILAAVGDADIVVTITTASAPILHNDWLKPGALVLSMGGDLEMAFDIWESAGLRLVDDLDYALWRGDFAGWMKGGEITRGSIEARLDGTIGDVATGRIDPSAPRNGRIFAVVQGLTALDLALASTILSRTPPQG